MVPSIAGAEWARTLRYAAEPSPFYENGRAVQRALRTMRQASMRAQGT
jgi:hypothetical protein